MLTNRKGMVTAMTRGEAAGIYGLLDSLGIAHRSTTHPPAYGMDDLPPIEAALGAAFCKNLFLCNRQKTEFFLLLIRGDKRFRTAEVSRKLGKSRLSFGDEAQMFEKLGVRPGAVSPLGLVFDLEHTLSVVIDRDLPGMDEMAMHIGTNAESVVIPVADLLDKYIPHCGHVPVYLEITGEDPAEGSAGTS